MEEIFNLLESSDPELVKLGVQMMKQTQFYKDWKYKKLEILYPWNTWYYSFMYIFKS